MSRALFLLAPASSSAPAPAACGRHQPPASSQRAPAPALEQPDARGPARMRRRVSPLAGPRPQAAVPRATGPVPHASDASSWFYKAGAKAHVCPPSPWGLLRAEGTRWWYFLPLSLCGLSTFYPSSPPPTRQTGLRSGEANFGPLHLPSASTCSVIARHWTPPAPGLRRCGCP
jgi:hypothetical protein